MALLKSAGAFAAQAREGARADTRGVPLEIILAALPPLLMGIMLSAFLLGLVPLPQIVWGGPTRLHITNPVLLAYVVPGLLGTVLIIGGLYGAAARLPRWSYTWATAAVVVVLFGLAILGDELPFLISPTVDMLLVLSLVGLLGLLALVGAWRAPHAAVLVGLSFAGTFAAAITFFATAGPFSRLDIGLLSTPVGWAFGLLIVLHLRGGLAGTRIAVAAAAGLTAALIWGYRTVVLAGIPSSADSTFHWRLLAIGWIGLLAPLLLSWLLRLRRPADAG